MRVVEDLLIRETIGAITQLIVERSQPEQIILFGNCAAATRTRTATWTLWWCFALVSNPRRHGNAIWRAITYHFVVPVDLQIRSYETFAKYRPNPNPSTMLRRMLQDSEVLYDRRAA